MTNIGGQRGVFKFQGWIEENSKKLTFFLVKIKCIPVKHIFKANRPLYFALSLYPSHDHSTINLSKDSLVRQCVRCFPVCAHLIPQHLCKLGTITPHFTMWKLRLSKINLPKPPAGTAGVGIEPQVGLMQSQCAICPPSTLSSSPFTSFSGTF